MLTRKRLLCLTLFAIVTMFSLYAGGNGGNGGNGGDAE